MIRTSEQELPGSGGEPPMRVLCVRSAAVAGRDLRPVVLAHHRTGADDFMLGVAERVAPLASAVFIPDFFHGRWADQSPRERKARLTDTALIDDLELVAGLATQQEGARKSVIIGFCMGGRIAALAAVATRGFELSLSFYGGDLDRSWGGSRTPFDWARRKTDCALQLHHGRLDTNPSPDVVAAFSSAARNAGSRVDAYTYDAGHAFMNELRPEVFHPMSAQLGWERIEESLVRAAGTGSLSAGAAVRRGPSAGWAGGQIRGRQQPERGSAGE